ncbi:MAG TPA: TIR-like protein FxsC, partial [Blastocatellia bacterium]|nr:TIR-like protein FxsC [Blastocatellia bacterium]
MSYWFYLSYAREDNKDGDITRFFEDLRARIAAKTGTRDTDTIGFIDIKGIELNEQWGDALAKGLQTSRSLVSLFSPFYFQKKLCGKEWAVFAQRQANYEATLTAGQSPPTLILPVLWENYKDVEPLLPPAVSYFQFQHSDFGKNYSKYGLRQLMRLNKFQDDYLEFLEVFTDKLIATVHAHPLPPLPSLPTLDEITPAFPVTVSATTEPEAIPLPVIPNPQFADSPYSTLTDAYDRIVNFARHFDEPHITLAMHAAVPLGLTPELVHFLRLYFAPSAPQIAEADLLLSSLCREVGGGLYEMYPEVRELLLAELREDEAFGSA